MSHFEIAATVYSALSTLGLALTAYYGRKFLLGIEQRLSKDIQSEVLGLYQQSMAEASHLSAHLRVIRESSAELAEGFHESLKADIARVEKWITEHAEELKARAEDLRVRALDLHDKTQAGPTRQPPTRS